MPPVTLIVPPPVTLPTVGGGGSTTFVIFATKPSAPPPANTVWKAPGVVGKLIDEGIGSPLEGSLEGARCGGEVGRSGLARNISVAQAVHGDAKRVVIATSAKVGGINQPGARRIQLRHEGVVEAAAVTRLKRPRG